MCTGTAVIDTNDIAGRSGPLCLDQIGAGAGAIAAQLAEPAYFWGNVNKGSGSANTSVTPRVAVYNGSTPIVLGRDYINAARPGYAPYPYPHPLQQDVIASFLRAPTSLRIQETAR